MFDANNLTVIAYGGGFTLWHYTTSDPLHHDPARPTAAVTAGGYFNAANTMLSRGNVLMVNAGTGGTSVIEGAMMLVTDSGGRGVSVALMASVVAPVGKGD